MADRKDIDLYTKLDQKHPDYKAWIGEWQRYSDVVGDREPFDKTDYLPKGKKENKSLYDLRVSLAEFIPESPLAIDKIIGALFQETPKRELPKALDPFIDDVTLNSHSINEFMKDVAFNLLTYGCIRALGNMNSPEGIADIGRQLTRKEVQELNVRPYLIQYTPHSIIDWELDQYKNLSMIRIFEEDSIFNPVSFMHEPLHRFIQYTRETMQWWTFKQPTSSAASVAHAKRGWELVPSLSSSPIEHQLGRVPLIAKNLKTIKPMIGRSFIRYSSLADIQKFRAESDMIYDSYVHSHPTLKVWAQRDMSSIGVGTNTFVKLDKSENEDMEYVEVPSSAFEALKRIADDRRDSVYRQAKTDPLGVIEGSPLQASGVARAWSFGTSEARLLTDLAGIMEEIEREIFTLALVYQGNEEAVKDIIVTYPSEFDMSSLSQLIDDSEKITDQINSPTLQRVLHKRIASAKAGNVPAEVLTQIHEEIDTKPLKSNVSTAPEEMSLPFGEEEEGEGEEKTEE